MHREKIHVTCSIWQKGSLFYRLRNSGAESLSETLIHRHRDVSQSSTLKHKERLLWFSKGSWEHKLLTTSHSSPPGANDTASQPSGILPALRHQPGPVINPAGMAGLSQWPHTTSWGSHDEAANVHSLLKSSAPAPNYFSGLIGSKVPVEFWEVARSLCWCAVFSGLHVSIWILLRTTQVFIEPTVLCIFKNIKYLMPLFIHPNFALVGNRETKGEKLSHIIWLHDWLIWLAALL